MFRKGGRKSGAGAAWKKSQEPEPLKNLPAPQPWVLKDRNMIYKSLIIFKLYDLFF